MSSQGNRNDRDAPEAVELLEQAVHLLRSHPASLLARYYLGTIPFALALVHFWADMSIGADARRRCTIGALSLTLLFVWMKLWHNLFCSRALSILTGRPGRLAGCLPMARTALRQTVFHATGLIAVPVAVLTTFPLPAVYAFYQNLTTLDDGATADLPALARVSAAHACQWPRQGYLLVSLVSALGLFLLVNVALTLAILPVLARNLLGIETAFSRAGALLLLNTTFLMAALVITALILDPLLKTMFVLRCFYVRSLRTGEDLRLALRRATAPRLAAAVCLLLPLTAAAAPPPARPGPPGHGLPAEDLDRAITTVLARRQFAWRTPEETAPDNAARPILDTIGEVFDAAFDILYAIRDTIDRWLGRDRSVWRTGPSTTGAVETLLYALLAATCVALVIAFLRSRRRKPATATAESPAATAAPVDVADESVAADRLPSADWMAMAAKLIDSGEFRLAVRALYLALLADLADRELLVIARHKSNRDYCRELQRRAHALPETHAAFDRTVAIFDQVWYGRYQLERPLFDTFRDHVSRAMSHETL